MTERWKPLNREKYFFVGRDFEACSAMWLNDFPDNTRLKKGNCFRTEAEAEAAAKKVKALLLSLHDTTQVTTQDTTQVEMLPDWCKVGEWVWDVEDSRYVMVKSITDRVLLCTKSKCTYYEELKDMTGNYEQARLRPYNADEMKALVGKVIITPDGVSLICSYDVEDEKIEITTAFYDAQQLLENALYIDGKPCGVLEHLNDDGEWVE